MKVGECIAQGFIVSAKVTYAAAEGVVQGFINTGNVVLHPLHFVSDVACAIKVLAKGTARLALEVVKIDLFLEQNPAEAEIYFNQLGANALVVCQALKQQATLHGAVSQTTTVITETVLQGKIAYQLGELFSNASLRAVQLAEDLKSEIVPATEVLLATVEGAEVALAKETIPFLKNEVFDQSVKHGMQQGAKTLRNIEQQTTKSLVECNDVRSAAQYDMLKKSLKAEEEAALKVQSIQIVYTEIIVKEKLFEAPTKAAALEQIKKIQSLSIKIEEVIKEAVNTYNDFKVFIEENNNIVIAMTKPGKVIGSKAVYYQKISPNGVTLEMFKDTFDNKGIFLHRKFKKMER